MKIQYASDLHLEFMDPSEFRTPNHFRWILEPVAPVLVLAGDISTHDAVLLPRFLTYVSKSYEHVFWVMGNHEYYSSEKLTMSKILETFRAMCPDNVHILDNETFDIDNIRFVGTTLWAKIAEEDWEEVQYYINDFRRIRLDSGHPLIPSVTVRKYYDNLRFLQEVIDSTEEKKLVIISHHSPISKGTSFHEYEGKVTNQAYASDVVLDDKDKIALWIYGHTHHNARIQKGSYQVVSNQLGYHGEHTGIWYEFGQATLL